MDLYERLDLQPEASEREIKKAYRTLSVKYHPDKNKGNEAALLRFREITEAYEVLSDKEKRVICARQPILAFCAPATPRDAAPAPPSWSPCPPLPLTATRRLSPRAQTTAAALAR